MNTRGNDENKKAIEALYKEYRNIIYLKIKSQCFSKKQEDIEDCISQTFFIALENGEELKVHPNPKAYLLKTAANVTRNFNHKYNKDLLKTKPIDDDIISPVSVEEQVDEKMTVEKIYRRNIYRNIMNDLTPEQKELYFLYFMEEKSSAEIASLMNEKNGTIRMRISRLRFSIINKVKDLLK